jgi:hypothetical protein
MQPLRHAWDQELLTRVTAELPWLPRKPHGFAPGPLVRTIRGIGRGALRRLTFDGQAERD